MDEPFDDPYKEEGLRQRFRDLRAAEQGGVPAFDAVLSRARSPRRARRVWPVLAAAAAVVMLAVVTLRARRADELVVPSEVMELSSWTPPTDVLLDGARMQLITRAPALGASMVDTLRGAMR